MNPKHVLYLLAGPSGTGKDTAADMLCENTGMKKVLSRTTRPKRYETEDTHMFMSDSAFLSLLDSGQIVSYTFFDGYHYGATREDLISSDIFITDVSGILSLRRNKEINDKIITYVIVFTADSTVRYTRMFARGDSPQKAHERIAHDEHAFRHLLPLADITIDTGNRTPLETVQALESAIITLSC